MKGISTEAILAIAAVIFIIIIIYFAWSKGFFPFLGVTSQSDCQTDLAKVCGNALTWDSIADKDKNCWTYFSGSEQSNLKTCLGDTSSDACNTFCRLYSSA